MNITEAKISKSLQFQSEKKEIPIPAIYFFLASKPTDQVIQFRLLATVPLAK